MNKDCEKGKHELTIRLIDIVINAANEKEVDEEHIRLFGKQKTIRGKMESLQGICKDRGNIIKVCKNCTYAERMFEE